MIEDISLIIIFILGLIIIFLFLNILYLNKSQTEKINIDFQNYNYDYSLLDEASYKQFDKSVYSLNEQQFYLFISNNYKYKHITQDCKYWSYFYYKIFNNLGYKTQYVLFKDQHIFLVAYNKHKYIVIDGLNIQTTNLE